MGKIPNEEGSNSVRKYSLGYLRPYHLEIARRMVLGERAASICRSLGMSQSRMSIIVNSPLFKRELKRLELLRDQGVYDVSRTLQELAPIALEQVERTMYIGETARLRFDAAESILDRAGVSRINKSQVDVRGTFSHHGMSDLELRKLVVERVNRMRGLETEKNKELEEANAITIELDQNNEEENEGERIPSFGVM